MQTLFVYIFDFFEKRKAAYWLCFVLVFALSIAGALRIKFVQDINQAIPHDPAIEAMNDVLNKTKTGDQLIFTMSFRDSAATDPDALIAFQQVFQEKLEFAGKTC